VFDLKTVFIGIRESVFWKKNVLFSLLYLMMLPRAEIYVHEGDNTGEKEFLKVWKR